MLTPAMENVIRRRDTNFLNFHYADSDSDNDSYEESSGSSEFVPVHPIRLPVRRLGTRIGLRNRPLVRRQSCDSDSSHSDSIEYESPALVPTPKKRRLAARAPPRVNKLSSRQFSNGEFIKI